MEHKRVEMSCLNEEQGCPFSGADWLDQCLLSNMGRSHLISPGFEHEQGLVVTDGFVRRTTEHVDLDILPCGGVEGGGLRLSAEALESLVA
jgi:hypothetical protein